MNKAQLQAFNNAYTIISNIFIKQERILPFNEVYGDGTRYNGLTKKGVETIYTCMIESIED